MDWETWAQSINEALLAKSRLDKRICETETALIVNISVMFINVAILLIQLTRIIQ
ncbi:MAG: hypothetical protein J6H31_01165 [Butyrivibrio sp.]|nr:hypothetical protein [Butyrivibrio sp.]